jgi:hypothetical protein
VTQKAGQAFNVMASTSNKELYSYDGVVVVVSNEIPSHVICHM